MRSEASSFVEEVARRTWSDAKRRPAAGESSFGNARNIAANRKDLRYLSPAEAAAEIRRKFHDRKADLSNSRRPGEEGSHSNETKSAILEAAERKWAEISGRGKRGQAAVQAHTVRPTSLAGAGEAARADAHNTVAIRPELLQRQASLSQSARGGSDWEPARRPLPSDRDLGVTVTAEVAGGHGGGAWLPGVGRWSAPSQLDEVILGIGPEDLPPSPPRRSLRSRDPPAPGSTAVGADIPVPTRGSENGAADSDGAASFGRGGEGWRAPFRPSNGDSGQSFRRLQLTAAPPSISEVVNVGGIFREQAEDSGDSDAVSREKAEEDEVDSRSGSNQQPARESELLVSVSGKRGRAAQDMAADELRALLHDREIANSLGKDRWALEGLAQPLLDGSERARVSCCACLRHIALSEEGAAAMGRSPIVLRGLVVAMQDGGDAARQKAAAALGNLAWRSEANRRAVAAAGGAIDGLLALLREGSGRCRESALAALSNVTLHGPSTAAVAGRPGALEALAGELLSGTPKAQLRAAGILRNLAIEKGNRSVLRCCAALEPALEQAATRAASGEARHRARFALQLLAGEIDAGKPSEDAPALASSEEVPDTSGSANRSQPDCDTGRQQSRLEAQLGHAENSLPRSGSASAAKFYDWDKIKENDGRSGARGSGIYGSCSGEGQLGRGGAAGREENGAASLRGGDGNGSAAHQTATALRDRTIDEEAAEAEAEAEAVERLGLWLHRNGWDAVQERLFDLGETRYGRYARIEPDMVSLDEARGLYLWRGRTLRLVGPDRYNPLLLVDTASREVIWDWESETTFAHPWARRYLVCRAEGGTMQVLLRRTGVPVAITPNAAATRPTSKSVVVSETPLTTSAELRSPSPQRTASQVPLQTTVRTLSGSSALPSISEPKQREVEDTLVIAHLPVGRPEGCVSQEDRLKSGRIDEINTGQSLAPAQAATISPKAPGPVPRPEPPLLSLAGRSSPTDADTMTPADTTSISASPTRETDGAGLELVLDLDFDEIATTGKQRLFRATLARDLAAAAGVGAHRLSITSVRPADQVLRPGGIETVLEVLPPAAEDLDRRSADMLIMELVGQAGKSDSFLLAGQISARLLLIKPGQRGSSTTARQKLPNNQSLRSHVGAGSPPASQAFLQGYHLGEIGAASGPALSASTSDPIAVTGIGHAMNLAERTSPGSAPSLSASRLAESQTNEVVVSEMASAVFEKSTMDAVAAAAESVNTSGSQVVSDQVSRAVITVRMTLDLDLSAVGNLPQFRGELQRDLAAAAGLELRRISIRAVAAVGSSAVVDFEGEITGKGSDGVADNGKATAAAAVRELQYQCADPQSVLRRGLHTCRVTALVPLEASAAPVATMAPIGTVAAAIRAAAKSGGRHGGAFDTVKLVPGSPRNGPGDERDGKQRMRWKSERQDLGHTGNGTGSDEYRSGTGTGTGGLSGSSDIVNGLTRRTQYAGNMISTGGLSAKPASNVASTASMLPRSPPIAPSLAVSNSYSVPVSSSESTLSNGNGFETSVLSLAVKVKESSTSDMAPNSPLVTSGSASAAGPSHTEQTMEPGNAGSAISHTYGPDLAPFAPIQEKRVRGITVSRSDPELWRRLMTEGEGNEAGEILLGHRRLRGPTYDEAGLASVLDSDTGALFYQGPGRHEVFSPSMNAISTLAAAGFGLLVEWCEANGWHDLQHRLLDAGRTDFASYTRYEQEMRAAPDGVPGQFLWRGKRLRLVGQSRWEPQKLLDERTGEVLWDRFASTIPLHPWARDLIRLERLTSPAGNGEDRVRIFDRKSGRLLLELEHAAFRDIPLRRTPLQTPLVSSSNIKSASVLPTVSTSTIAYSGTYGHAENTLDDISEANGTNLNSGPSSSIVSGPALGPPLHGQIEPLGADNSAIREGENSQSSAHSRGPSRVGLDSEAQHPTQALAMGAVGPKPEPAMARTLGKAVGNNFEGIMIREVVLRLREWTAEKGWYELKKRLFDAGETDYRAYAAIEPDMRPIEGQSGTGGELLYSYRGRTLGLMGQKMDPHLLRDIHTGEVLWDFEKSTSFTYPWARTQFLLRPKSSGQGRGNVGAGRFQIVNRGTGAVVVEYGAPHSGCPPEASPLLLQAILMEAVPLVEGLGLQALLAEGLEVVQVIKDYDPSPSDQIKGQASSQLLLRCGDLLQVRQHGRQGWNLGRVWKRVADKGHGPSSDGNEGWFPSTYAAPVQELATWRGRLIRISSREEMGKAHVVVGDTQSGTIVFRGPAEVPSIEWSSPWDFDSNNNDSNNDGDSPSGQSAWSPRTSQRSGQAAAAARAVWATNGAAFESGVSRRYSSMFKSNSSGHTLGGNGDSELLELRADGRFVAITNRGQSEMLQLQGVYKALPGSDPDIIILRIETAADAGKSQQVQEDGIFLRAKLTSSGGRVVAVEWVSGHEDLGFGSVGSLLATNSGQAPSYFAPRAPTGPPGTRRRG